MSTALGNQRIPMPGLPRSAQSLLQMLEGMHCGQLTLKTPEGDILQFQGAESGIHAEWVVNDWRILSLLARDGDIAFGRGYMEGLWESSDPVALLRLAIANRGMVEKYIEGSWFRRLIFTLLNRLLRANTRRGSRKNISFHYDLGNEFYQLWLDSSMTYSSALYDGDDSLTLTDAQERKYARALSALNLAPGSRLLEIGCGWGGFAEYAARRGFFVHGITLSKEQLAYAKERLEKQGLSHLTEFSLMDYRDLQGHYDGIVSIEMLEAVGAEWWSSYFQQIHQLLRRGGRALIQSITIADARFSAYQKSSDFIRHYVFPGGMLPSPARLQEEISTAGLQLLERKDFGQDYARTLRIWRQRFDIQEEAVKSLGYDSVFCKMWRFYLVYCEAGFAEGEIDLTQVTLTHG
ncbi:cyclopropane-fatty-acyl-phospholipid synthase family protein [Acidithiobacillus sp.]|uniref:SAM-dependent methyltransferase n=1 Tax=Acidithiobacillus sp. TaxID=1872118 RepID=UPI002632C7DC|nr:cyclopropane-fatty-acyl-phospholipid synthase family protein [Acidithiobacillus sp.]MDD2750847.1 cyclopropane-fatty-acyl-phospholipid synthase [Acidithiobacillus sp.]MDD5279131.1 cyclopropane-fatty-acyl-phospholipid synthase [Acidithiobacillus sp.]